MNRVDIRKSIEADVLPIAFNMREDDVKEVWDSNHLSPYKALRSGLDGRGNVWTVLLNGKPIGMLGVGDKTLLSDRGSPWLLGTDDLINNKKIFLKVSRIVLKNISKGYKKLENYVSVENKGSLIWLKKLGFRFGEDIKNVKGVIFRRFYMEIE